MLKAGIIYAFYAILFVWRTILVAWVSIRLRTEANKRSLCAEIIALSPSSLSLSVFFLFVDHFRWFVVDLAAMRECVVFKRPLECISVFICTLEIGIGSICDIASLFCTLDLFAHSFVTYSCGHCRRCVGTNRFGDTEVWVKRACKQKLNCETSRQTDSPALIQLSVRCCIAMFVS